jgi:hypothetical protein
MNSEKTTEWTPFFIQEYLKSISCILPKQYWKQTIDFDFRILKQDTLFMQDVYVRELSVPQGRTLYLNGTRLYCWTVLDGSIEGTVDRCLLFLPGLQSFTSDSRALLCLYKCEVCVTQFLFILQWLFAFPSLFQSIWTNIEKTEIQFPWEMCKEPMEYETIDAQERQFWDFAASQQIRKLMRQHSWIASGKEIDKIVGDYLFYQHRMRPESLPRICVEQTGLDCEEGGKLIVVSTITS